MMARILNNVTSLALVVNDRLSRQFVIRESNDSHVTVTVKYF